MRHVEKALNKFKIMNESSRFIFIENKEDNPGIAPIIKIPIQSAPVGYCESEGGEPLGINGLQAVDMLEYVEYLFESLNEEHPCEENVRTIALIQAAIVWQNKRTEDRTDRGVEGTNAD